MSQLSRHSDYAINPIEEEDGLAYRLASKGGKIIALNRGNPPSFFPTPKYTIDAYVKALRSGKTGYSFHSGVPELRRIIADRHKRLYHTSANEDDVVVTQGVSESLIYINSLFIDPSDRALVFRPYYPLYMSCLQINGGVPAFVDYHEGEGYGFDPDRLRRAIRSVGRKRPKFMVFSNPCNPTGTVMERKELKEIAEIAKDSGIFVISDEIYDEIIYNGARFTSFSEVSKGIPAVILGGASKNYDSTGFRIGYTLFTEHDGLSVRVREKLCDFAKMRLSSNTPAQYAFAESISNVAAHRKAVEKMVGQIEKRADFIYDMIKESDYMSVARPRGAFYALPRVDMSKLKFKNDRELIRKLLVEEGVQVTRGSGFGAPNHLRIVVLAPEALLESAIQKINKFFVRHSK